MMVGSTDHFVKKKTTITGFITTLLALHGSRHGMNHPIFQWLNTTRNGIAQEKRVRSKTP